MAARMRSCRGEGGADEDEVLQLRFHDFQNESDISKISTKHSCDLQVFSLNGVNEAHKL